MVNAKKILKTQEEELKKKAQEDAQKAQDEMIKNREAEMTAIVVFARDKLLPFLNKKNKPIDEGKQMFEMLAVTIQQGLFNLMRENKVEMLNLAEKITNNYPDYENYQELIKILNGETMMMATEGLQWLNAKIDMQLKEERKDRKFKNLKLKF